MIKYKHVLQMIERLTTVSNSNRIRITNKSRQTIILTNETNHIISIAIKMGIEVHVK